MILLIALLIFGALVSYAWIAFFTFMICWAFGLVFSWKFAFGLWLVYLLVKTFTD